MAIIVALALLGFIYSGIYPIGADVPHARITSLLLETLRERSIEEASARIAVPPLDDAAMIARGGAEYDEMCAGCHLKPGLENTELRMGLYPQPPNLSTDRDRTRSMRPPRRLYISGSSSTASRPRRCRPGD